MQEIKVRVKEKKAGSDTWDLTNHKSLCAAKETITPVERQQAVLASWTSDRQSASRACKELTKLNSKKTFALKTALNREFSKEIQTANKHL